MRRNAFHTNVYIRPLAFKSAERIGVSTDDQDCVRHHRPSLRRVFAQ